MEKNRIVLFNILKKRAKSILQSLLHGNNNLIRDLRGLLEGIPGISKEELERVETVDDLWDFLVRKEVISMDDLQVLKNVARYIKSKELEEEVKSYEYESSGKLQMTEPNDMLIYNYYDNYYILYNLSFHFYIYASSELVIRSVLSIGTGLLFLSFCGENESAKQDIQKKLVLPPLTKLHEVYEGSVCFVIETTSLSSLKQLWRSYKDGSLKKKFQKVINEIDEVRKVTQGTEVDVTVEIDEEEYREACWVLVLAEIEQAEVEQDSSKSIQRPRRHSLSCEQDFLPTCDKTRFSWTALKEAENKLARETRRRIYVEKENEKLRQVKRRLEEENEILKQNMKSSKEIEMLLRKKMECEEKQRIQEKEEDEWLRQEMKLVKERYEKLREKMEYEAEKHRIQEKEEDEWLRQE
ncbi:inner centromere protein-like, partial [Actinia tenebrosa]|uniref:Inner centromere protein-like n=1 Tax=Actinia tenebrosa TaxID=6105 RepID=A0A6P8IEQ6_ACTTE